jgi:hypothetical protein
MTVRRIVGATMTALFVGLVGHAAAQSLSCNGSLAGTGDSKTAVMQKCGPPMVAEQVCINSASGGLAYQVNPYTGQSVLTQQCVPMEDWTYDRGHGRFMAIVRFQNGTVESVRDGDRRP